MFDERTNLRITVVSPHDTDEEPENDSNQWMFLFEEDGHEPIDIRWHKLDMTHLYSFVPSSLIDAHYAQIQSALHEVEAKAAGATFYSSENGAVRFAIVVEAWATNADGRFVRLRPNMNGVNIETFDGWGHTIGIHEDGDDFVVDGVVVKPEGRPRSRRWREHGSSESA